MASIGFPLRLERREHFRTSLSFLSSLWRDGLTEEMRLLKNEAHSSPGLDSLAMLSNHPYLAVECSISVLAASIVRLRFRFSLAIPDDSRIGDDIKYSTLIPDTCCPSLQCTLVDQVALVSVWCVYVRVVCVQWSHSLTTTRRLLLLVGWYRNRKRVVAMAFSLQSVRLSLIPRSDVQTHVIYVLHSPALGRTETRTEGKKEAQKERGEVSE